MSMFFFTTAGSGDWNSHTLPQPQNTTPLSANCFLTAARWSAVRVGSTPCLWVVRNPTAAIPTAVHTYRMVGRSHWAATLYVTIPSLNGGLWGSAFGPSARTGVGRPAAAV